MSVTEVLMEAAKQVPSFLCLVAVVLFFLKHQTQRDEMIRETARECHENQKEATKAIIKNAEAMTSLTVIIQERLK